MKRDKEQHTDSSDCVCQYCRLRKPFTLPESVVADCHAGRLAIFAGAGISTEGMGVLPRTFYQEICESLAIDLEKAKPFPDVMSAFVEQPNGRRLLLRKIRDRLAYVHSFAEIYGNATRFHRELATLHQADVIVTTNWDDYFERECGATPFVAPEDFAFWDVPGRKVFKLHGSVNSYSSLVATRPDYEACFERLSTGLLGGHLKLMLATKTVVYVGFSFRDDDFLRLHDVLSREMRGLRPQSYIVTLDRESEERFREHGLIPIYTDATFFVEQLKARLVKDGDMLPDLAYSGVDELTRRVLATHFAVTDTVDLQESPDVIYTLFYQDGLHHALERIMTMRDTGYYSHVCNPRNTVLSYEKRRKDALRAQNYADVAYIDGYINGHVFFLAPPPMRRFVPMYFLFGHEAPIKSLAAYKRLLKKAPRLHKAASRAARRTVTKKLGGVSALLHHPPWL